MYDNHMIVQFAIALVFGWVCGIIPFCYIIARIKGVDLRTTGSKNIGATNLGRTCGLPFFLMGFLLDSAKGLVPVLIARSLMLPAVGAGVGAIIGHLYNPLFKGKGGKGVSTTIGVALGLVPISFAISLGIWLVIYLCTLLVSVASICLATILPIAAFIFSEGNFIDRSFLIILGILIIVAHRKNIQRLIKGTEPKTKLWRKT